MNIIFMAIPPGVYSNNYLTSNYVSATAPVKKMTIGIKNML